MKVLGGGGGINDLNILLCREGQKAFQPCTGMFRSASLKSMWEQQHQSGKAPPFVFSADNKLVNNYLGGIYEITKLRFPKYQTIRKIQAVTVIKAEHASFRKRAIENIHRHLVGSE